MPYATACIAMLVVMAALWKLRTKMGRAYIAGAIFLLTLLPGLLSPVHAQTVTTISEHYLYFPMIGVALLAFFGLENITPQLQSETKKVLGILGILGILGFFCVATFNQVSVWRDSPTLFTAVRKLYPRSVAVLTNLGTAYAQIGMYGEAESVLRQAIGINPDAVQARFNYAGLRYIKGNYAGAIEEYKRVLDAIPSHQDALRMLTWSYYRAEKMALARETYDIVIHLNPSLRSQLPPLNTPPSEYKNM
jgi:tetratricopeptide (TPR) repeat protein